MKRNLLFVVIGVYTSSDARANVVVVMDRGGVWNFFCAALFFERILSRMFDCYERRCRSPCLHGISLTKWPLSPISSLFRYENVVILVQKPWILFHCLGILF